MEDETAVSGDNENSNNGDSENSQKTFAIEVRISREESANFELKSDECQCQRNKSNHVVEGQVSHSKNTTDRNDDSRIQISDEKTFNKMVVGNRVEETNEIPIQSSEEIVSELNNEATRVGKRKSGIVEGTIVEIYVPVIRVHSYESEGGYPVNNHSRHNSDSSVEDDHVVGIVLRDSDASSDDLYSEVDLGDSGPSSLNSRDEESSIERNEPTVQENNSQITRIPFFHLFSSSAPNPLNNSTQNRSHLNPFRIMVSPLPVLSQTTTTAFSLHDLKPSMSSSFFSSVMTLAFVGILWFVIFMVFGSRGHAIAGVFIGLFFIGLLINTCFLKLYFRLRLFFGLNAVLAAAEQESAEAERRRQMQNYILTQKATEKPPSYASVLESPPPYDLLQYYKEDSKPTSPCSTSDNSNLQWHRCPFCGKNVPVFGLCPPCQIKLSQ